MVGIRYMEMPENCLVCDMMCDGNKGVSRCYITGEASVISQAKHSRSEKCPLVKLEEQNEN